MPASPRLQLSLLGAMSAATASDLGERRLAKGKPVALLAFLALAPGCAASRERLATLLWSDGSSESARQNLRQTIWYVRRRLGDILTADDSTVRLDCPVESDLAEFVEAARHERFEDAIALYRGDFVPEFAAPGAADFEDWAELERRRLRATFLACAEARIRRLLGSGQASEALGIARSARAVASAESWSWRLLLECLIAARDRIGIAVALAQIDGVRERDEFEPDAATESLLRAARRLQGEGSREPSREAGPDHAFVPDLVGRATEFRQLIDAWEHTQRGTGRAIAVIGAAGLGKSRLLADFEARLLSARGRCVSIAAHPGNRSIEAGLAAQIAEVLSTLPGAAAISPESASVLIGLSPRVASAFPGAAADRSTGEDAVRRRAAALGELLEVLADARALALLIDDAHWADEVSLRVLAALVAKAVRARVLVVVSSRIRDDLNALGEGATGIALRPLDAGGVAEFLGRLATLPAEPWTGSFVPRLHQLTNGIPLLIIETLQRMEESGALTRVDGTWVSAADGRLEEFLGSGSALQARVATLEPRERTALLRLATLGRPIERRGLQADDAVSDWSEAIAELERRSFVTRAEGTVRVWHDEVARVTLELATGPERDRAHAWCADTLLLPASTLSEFALAAMHADRADDPLRVERIWHAAITAVRRTGDTRAMTRIADDVLPVTVRGVPRDRLLGRTPWRARLTRRARLVAALAAVCGGAGTAAAFMTSHPARTVGIALLDPTDSTRAFTLELDPTRGWKVGEPLVARARTLPPALGLLHRTSRMFADPLHGGLLASAKFADAGGDEIVEISPSGAVRRIAPDSADDFESSASPDGRLIAFSTRRFDRVAHQAEVVVYDRARERLRRLTSTDDDETHILWSPDGTRLAFRRRFAVEDRSAVACLMTVDGAEERCVWKDVPEGIAPIAWASDRHLLVRSEVSRSLYRIDTESGEGTYLGRAPGMLAALHGTEYLFHLYFHAESQQEIVAVAPVFDPLAMRLVVHAGRFVTSGRFAVTTAPDDRRYVERLEFNDPPAEASLDGGAALRVTGFTPADLELSLRGLRFTTSDSAVVKVRQDGILEPSSPGTAWVHASAGGWRVDSTRVRIVPGSSRTVLTERWEDRLDLAWRSFGQPAPRVASADRVSGLDPSGDGKYASGAYSRTTFSTRDGVGLEARIRLPLKRLKLQHLTIALHEAGDPAELLAWDHTTGYGPFGSMRCGTTFPWTEGPAGRRRVVVLDGSGQASVNTAPIPEDLFMDRWHTLRLQLTPDGRCAMYLNGRLMARSTGPARNAPAVRVVLSGASVGGAMLVGPIELWEGVRLPTSP